MLLKESRAVNEAVNVLPAVAFAGAVSKKFEAEPGLTMIEADPEGPEVSEAVSVAFGLDQRRVVTVEATPAVNETEVAGNVGAVPLGAFPGPDHAIVCVPV